MTHQQQLEVYEGFSDYMKMLILNPQTSLAERKQYENIYDELRRRIRSNQTEVSGAALQWYLGSIGRSHCERTATGGLTRGVTDNPNRSADFRTCETLLPLNLNYGCWCHAGDNDVFKGSGDFVDEFDK